MTRDKMVTRTITNAVAQVMTVNTENATVETVARFIPENATKDNTTMLKYLNKNVDTDTTKSVSIVSVEMLEQLYGMSETLFVANAQAVDARTTTRERMVTRTITNAVAQVMTVNTQTATVETVARFIPENATKDNTTMLKYLNKNVDTDTTKSVSIVSVEMVEQLYIMPEIKFVELAEKLPPRGTKEDNAQ